IGRALTGVGVAIDPNGRTYVANAWLNTISIFAPDATGETLPMATIRGGATGLDSPEGIAFDARGNLYVANSGYSEPDVARVTVYPPGSEGNVAPIATISGPGTSLRSPSDVAVDSVGRIYVANQGVQGDRGSVTIYPPGSGDDTRAVGCVTVYRGGSNGDVAPIAIIRTGTGSPRGIAVDAAGKVYVT